MNREIFIVWSKIAIGSPWTLKYTCSSYEEACVYEEDIQSLYDHETLITQESIMDPNEDE